MDPIDKMKQTLYRIGLAKENFKWEVNPAPTLESTSYTGNLGPVNVIVVRYRIDGIEVLGIPHGGYGYGGVIRTGQNVIKMPPEMAEEFFVQAEKSLGVGHV